MIFSQTFEEILRSEIGLQFPKSDWSPFLNIGNTLACFQQLGTLAVDKDNCKSLVKEGAIESAVSFSILQLIPSGSVALDVSSLFKISNVSDELYL